ncbi:MAG: hypothetical protein JW743_12065 [Deltaproteobacteria bacterium]|nr:hypothetical protein [Deltaproteobacteria bacterium]
MKDTQPKKKKRVRYPIPEEGPYLPKEKYRQSSPKSYPVLQERIELVR